MRTYDDFRAGVFATIVASETARAVAHLGESGERDLSLIRAACERAGARLAPVAAYFGFLPLLGAPTELVDVTADNSGRAVVAGDAEALCLFALFRATGRPIRTEVVVVPPEFYAKTRDRVPPDFGPHPYHRADND
jgi:hypothetical protein